MMTDLTSRHVAMLTTFFLVCLSHTIAVLGAPVETEFGKLPLDKAILQEKEKLECVFPPSELKYPAKCSNLSLSSEVKPDMKLYDEYFLCAGLLDSTIRLCSETHKNGGFNKRVSERMKEESPLQMSTDDGFCADTHDIDSNAQIPQAKFLYSKLNPGTCNSICFGTDLEEIEIKQPICKSIIFAHQQILAAKDLQKKGNEQNNEANLPINSPESSVGKPAPFHATNQASSVLKKETQMDQNAGSSRSLDRRPPELETTAQSSAIKFNNTGKLPNKTPAVSTQQTEDEKKKSEKEISDGTKPVEETNKPIPEVDRPQAVENHQESVQTGVQNVVPKVDIVQPENAGQESPRNDDLPDDIDPGQPGGPDNVSDVGQDPAPDIQDEQGEDQNGAVPPEEDGQNIDDEDSETNKVQQLIKETSQKSPPTDKKIPETYANQHKNPLGVIGELGNIQEDDDSHFFAYFMTCSALFVLGYLVYHNKRKIIAMAVEGKKGRNTNRRRPNSASYHKLDSNLEEAMSSNLASTNSYVIY